MFLCLTMCLIQSHKTPAIVIDCKIDSDNLPSQYVAVHWDNNHLSDVIHVISELKLVYLLS